MTDEKIIKLLKGAADILESEYPKEDFRMKYAEDLRKAADELEHPLLVETPGTAGLPLYILELIDNPSVIGKVDGKELVDLYYTTIARRNVMDTKDHFELYALGHINGFAAGLRHGVGTHTASVKKDEPIPGS